MSTVYAQSPLVANLRDFLQKSGYFVATHGYFVATNGYFVATKKFSSTPRTPAPRLG